MYFRLWDFELAWKPSERLRRKKVCFPAVRFQTGPGNAGKAAGQKMEDRDSGKTKIGIMGGTFDPIHYGHLILAENACEQFGLEKVIFMPTGHAPHKSFAGDAMMRHRCEMVRLAIEDNPHFSLSLYETEQAQTSYTYETLGKIRTEHPDEDLYFILGADSLSQFDTWRFPEVICREATILAAVRDNLTERKVDEMIAALSDRYHASIYRLETPNFNVSSESIRERIRSGKTVRYLLPEKVETYIKKEGLYRDGKER